MTSQTSGSVKAPSVQLAAGDEASGMASMLGELLADNLRDFPARARVARLVRGPVVMTAADHNRSITVRFAGKVITIEEGATPGAPCMAGQWLDLAKVCSGGLSPFQAVKERKVQVQNLARADLLAAAGFVMSVPASYYGEVKRVARWQIVVGVLVILVVAMTIAALWRRRHA